MTRVLTAGAAIAGAAAALMAQAATAYQGGGPRASAQSLGALVAFTDLSRAAGLHFTHINGASPEKHLVETMGSGALFIDYDNDGLLDVFLVDGGSLANPKVAGRAQHRLFHNNGHGTFKDATAGSGIRQSGYGMGACAGDYDNDGLTDL